MINFLIIIAGILGLSIGSFFSVYIYRSHYNLPGIINGRSHCPNCQKQLQARDLVPIFSYLINRGKCRHCQHSISSRYLILELSFGIGFALISFLQFQSFTIQNISAFNFPAYILSLVIFACLAGAFFYDTWYQEIPDLLMIIGGASALVLNFFTNDFALDFYNLLISQAIIICFFGGQILISRGKWLGAGALTLGIFLACLLDWQLLLLTLILAYILGSIIAIALLLSKRITKQSKIAFGPFLIIGATISMLYGQELITIYLDQLGI